jgi:hypothetical protein
LKVDLGSCLFTTTVTTWGLIFVRFALSVIKLFRIGIITIYETIPSKGHPEGKFLATQFEFGRCFGMSSYLIWR